MNFFSFFRTHLIGFRNKFGMTQKALHFSFIAFAFASQMVSASPSSFQVPHASAENYASFGAFSTQYDHYLDVRYWSDEENSKYQGFFGFERNFLNIGASAELFGVYWAVDYDQQISNYRDWPENMTDEEIGFLIGLPSGWGIGGHYYDFCYTGGKGIIESGLEIGNAFGSGEKKLRVSLAGNYQLIFRGSLDIAYYQPNGELSVDWSKNESSGFGAKYKLMGTFDNGYEKAAPWYHRVSLWLGLQHFFQDNLEFVFRPELYGAFNSFYPGYDADAQKYAACPEWGNLEAQIIVPFSFKYHLGKFEQVKLITTVMIGAFYANFDHVYSTYGIHFGAMGMATNNDAGCVPYAGLGLGAEINVNKNMSVALSSRFVRLPEKNEEDSGRYSAENMSFSSISSEPLSLSIIFK